MMLNAYKKSHLYNLEMALQILVRGFTYCITTLLVALPLSVVTSSV
jgi:hypothetical protein